MKRFFAFLGFLCFYSVDVVKSNFRVAYDVLTPRDMMTPGIIAVNVAGMSDRQLLFMANLITMTPGTLGLAISADKTRLYIHVMYLEGSAEAAASEIENSYGRRVRDVF